MCIRDRLTPAHETLEQVRDLLAGMRQRNGVVVFSDHMNAYHEEMEHVVVDGPKQLADAAGAQALLARVGALDYLARRLRTQAPEALLRDAEFTALLAKVEAVSYTHLDVYKRQSPTSVINKTSINKLSNKFRRR